MPFDAFQLFRVRCIELGGSHGHVLAHQLFAVELEFGIDLSEILYRLAGNHARDVNHMEEDGCPLHMTQKFEPKACPFMCVLDKTWDVGDDKALPTFRFHHAQDRRKRGEGIVRDLGLGSRNTRYERGLTCIREAHEAYICKELEFEE